MKNRQDTFEDACKPNQQLEERYDEMLVRKQMKNDG